MESFVQPLKTSLWTVLFISVLFVGCSIFLLDCYSPFDRFYKIDRNQISDDDPFLERTSDDRVTFGEALWFVWGVLLNSGVAESESNIHFILTENLKLVVNRSFAMGSFP